MSGDLDLNAAAALLHRSYSWFQRHWRSLRHPVTGAPFPQPFVGGERGGRPWWRRAQVEAWIDGAAVGSLAADTPRHPTQREPGPSADNDAASPPRSDRAAALRAMAGG